MSKRHHETSMTHFNLNYYVIVYPTQEGWDKIPEIVMKEYYLTRKEADDWVDARRVDGGLKDQLWVLISLLSPLFSMGRPYLMNEISLINE